ncbi:glycosyltransferase family 2 protein [Bacteroides sp. AN502(2024)]|uniref:glycosyltransferase family 2 protein n=1 Tax=Bacteroides sp. AN502(2024) TaxID=3160599 RepID=UPI00351185E1
MRRSDTLYTRIEPTNDDASARRSIYFSRTGMQKRISIIIPIYNVASYLNECLNSVYHGYDAATMEIILVNDGSTDDSLAICKRYKQRYPDTILIDTPNGGLSAARNKGVEAASGRYIYFLDGDDWTSEDALQQLYDFAEKYRCEVVQGGFYYAYDTHLLYDTRLKKIKPAPILLTREEAMKLLVRNEEIKNFAWGKLYRAEIVKQFPFKEGVCFEDAFWQHLIIDKSVRYGIIPEPLYYYRQRSTGISSAFSLRNADLLKGYEERIAFIIAHYPVFLDELMAKYWHITYSFYRSSLSHPEDAVRKCYLDYWTYANDVYGDDFKKALRHSLTYRLVGHHSPWLSPYLFLKRVRNRFRISPFQKIPIR